MVVNTCRDGHGILFVMDTVSKVLFVVMDIVSIANVFVLTHRTIVIILFTFVSIQLSLTDEWFGVLVPSLQHE